MTNKHNSDLKLSKAGANLIKHYESCLKPVGGGKFKAYLDPVKVLTIGYGHTNHGVPKFTASAVWTQRECDDVFLVDMQKFEREVKRLVKVPLNQRQFDSLVSFAFNVGGGNLAKSTLLKKLNSGDSVGAAVEFNRWNKAGGKVLRGLTRRRASERAVFEGKNDQWYVGGAVPAGDDRMPHGRIGHS